MTPNQLKIKLLKYDHKCVKLLNFEMPHLVFRSIMSHNLLPMHSLKWPVDRRKKVIHS